MPLGYRSRMRTTGRRVPVWARLACHAAAEVPFVVVAVVGCATGWRATADDADIGYRAWDVFTARPPLVGSISQASGFGVPLVYHPGPVLSWALALPVRIDHVHGVLWGGALLAVVAAAVAVEAAYRVRGLPAAVAVAAVFVVVAARWPAVVLNPAWDPYAGLPWFVATMSVGWAVATGRLRWWPVLVGTASVAAEIHQMYAPASVALVVVTPLVGMVTAGGTGRWRRWLPAGLGVGALAWAVPLWQQVTGHPGNLGGVISYSRGQPTLGLAFGLRNLSTDAGVHPLWLGNADQSNLFTLIASIAAQRVAGGAAVLAAVVVIGAVAWRVGRRRMAALSVVVLVAAVGAVVTVAEVVTPKILTLGYVDLVLWPVGVAVWALVLWAGTATALWAWRRWRQAVAGGRNLHLRPAVAVGAAALVLAASVWATVSGGAPWHPWPASPAAGEPSAPWSTPPTRSKRPSPGARW